MTSDTMAGFWHEFAATQIYFCVFKEANALEQNCEQATKIRKMQIMKDCFSAEKCHISDFHGNQH
jgi:deoxyadenosine/deoxycytidine kinase